MRSLIKRLERLEKAVIGRDGTHDDIINKALWDVCSAEFDLIVSSVGAEQKGRPMNAEEAAARKRLAANVEERCRWKRLIPPKRGWRLTIQHIDRASPSVLAHRFSLEELDCFRDVLLRRDRGEDLLLTDEESGILEAYKSEMKRFVQLAGFESIEDFNRASGAAE